MNQGAFASRTSVTASDLEVWPASNSNQSGVFAMRNSCAANVYSEPAVTSYVLEVLGQKCLEDETRLATVFVYPLILALGTFGNLATCMLILRHKDMQTPTNLYLFSLACSDLIQLLLGAFAEIERVVAGSLLIWYGAPSFHPRPWPPLKPNGAV